MEEEYTYLLPSNVYKTLKWVALIMCPALATFIGVFFPTWGIPYADQVVTTINAFGLFLGGLLGLSASTAKQVEQPTQELVIPKHLRDSNED